MPAQLFDPNYLYLEETAFEGNQVLQQKFFKLPFSLDIHFGYRDTPFTEAEMNVTEATESFKKAEAALDKRFDEVFVHNGHQNTSHINGMPKVMSKFLELDDSEEWSEDQIATAKYAIGNMLGSMTYMYGTRQLFNKDHKIVSESPRSMFVIVPDRPDHAQGFMWDEGFHQHLISVWNMNLTQ